MFILSYFLTFYPDINAHPNILMIPMVVFVGIQALFCMIAALTVAIVVSAAARVCACVGVCVRVCARRCRCACGCVCGFVCGRMGARVGADVRVGACARARVSVCYHSLFAFFVIIHPFQPEAAGSGIPEIKCYLNGIRVSTTVLQYYQATTVLPILQYYSTTKLDMATLLSL